MIFGAHVIVYSNDAAADRRFFQDVLGLASLDAGQGWLIFALPPAELAVHPGGAKEGHELYFMCDDVHAEVRRLAGLGVRCSDIENARWGSVTHVPLPGGSRLGLYQPSHPLALRPP
jgi:catechol 2,3-dioxygenase-like lactoylglutathione lyase family enzyme